MILLWPGKPRKGQGLKMVTAQAVSRALGAHFKRSENSATRIRGWHYYTAGFEVMQSGFKAVVRYQTSSQRNQESIDIESLMNEYTNLLIAKGYTVSPITYWGSPAIIVSKEN